MHPRYWSTRDRRVQQPLRAEADTTSVASPGLCCHVPPIHGQEPESGDAKPASASFSGAPAQPNCRQRMLMVPDWKPWYTVCTCSVAPAAPSA